MIVIVAIILSIINSRQKNTKNQLDRNNDTNVTYSDNMNQENLISKKSKNELVLNAEILKDWDVEEKNEDEYEKVVTYTNDSKTEPMNISISIHKPIDSSNIQDIKQFIQKHQYSKYVRNNYNSTITQDMNFDNETTINSINWMKFSETLSVNHTVTNNIYATNQNNKLYLIETDCDSGLLAQYETTIEEIVKNIQECWDLNNPNEFNITIE